MVARPSPDGLILPVPASLSPTYVVQLSQSRTLRIRPRPQSSARNNVMIRAPERHLHHCIIAPAQSLQHALRMCLAPRRPPPRAVSARVLIAGPRAAPAAIRDPRLPLCKYQAKLSRRRGGTGILRFRRVQGYSTSNRAERRTSETSDYTE